jgi:capsular polysaccharide biosynthesis protein
VVKRGVVATTQLLAPITRRLPGTGERPSPPRFSTASTRDWADRHPGSGVEVVDVVPELQLHRPVPDGRPARHFVFEDAVTATVPAVIAARLPGGRAVGAYGAVISADDTLLFDLSPYYGAFVPSQHPIFLRPLLPPVHRVTGSVGVLTTRGVDNYYHFLTDVLPRLAVLEQAHMVPDRYLVNRRTRFQRDLLDLVGIGPDRVIASVEVPHLRADELLVGSLPDSHLRTPPWIVEWLRARLLPEASAPPRRRLYVTRGDRPHTRRVDNEREVLDVLEPLGFDVVDPGVLSVAEQVSSFAQAEMVVGPHGAGLTNIAFCPSGATVIELFPPDYVNPCYWNLAAQVDGLRYRYLVGDGRPQARRRMLGVSSDVVVDTIALRALIDG